MSRSLVEAILAAAGKPVEGHTLSMQEMGQTVEETRVIEIYTRGLYGRWRGIVRLRDRH